MPELPPYHDDLPFHDPVVRCYECKKIQLLKDMKDFGCCSNCGARKIAKLRTITEEELAQIKEWGVDPGFLALFEDRKTGTNAREL